MQEERRNALPIGTEFEGYRIDGILGAGGFGITYRADEVLLGRPVAIKEFLPAGIVLREPDGLNVSPLGALEQTEFAWGMDRFRIEAQTLVAFRHPNIVGVHRYFETNNTGYLVMEFVDGQTLSQMLLPDRTLDEDEVHAIFDPLMDGLQAVHDQGFLHRDIKPANIFLRDGGSPVLIDFGAARQAFGHHSKSLTAIISEGYAPYEQYDSAGEQGPWTDIYALGGVLYRCVTGERPPDAPSRISALVRGRDDPMEPVASAAKGDYSGRLLGAIDKALATREDDRHQTIGELRAAMRPPAAAPSSQESAPAPPAAAPPASDPADETLYAGAKPPAAGGDEGIGVRPPPAPAEPSAPADKPGKAAAPATATVFDPTPAARTGPGEQGDAPPARERAAAAAPPKAPAAATGAPKKSGALNPRIALPAGAAVVAAGAVLAFVFAGGDSSTGSGGGQAQLVDAPYHECDRLAAHPLDPNKKAKGAFRFQIDPAIAAPACEGATATYPKTPRFHYQHGRVLYLQKKRKAAFDSIKKAYDAGYPMAAYGLGFMYVVGSGYVDGKGPTLDRKRARKLHQEAAAKGVGIAATMMAFEEVMGLGMPKNVKAGMAKLEALAKSGDVQAKFQLSRLYTWGVTGKKEYEKAFRYLHDLMITHSDPRAYYGLYYHYYFGRGTEKDRKRARDMLKLAVEAGDPRSFVLMGLEHEYGSAEIRKNLEEAYFWYALALKNGIYNQKPAKKHLARVKPRLSASAIARLDKRVAAWRPKPPSR